MLVLCFKTNQLKQEVDFTYQQRYMTSLEYYFTTKAQQTEPGKEQTSAIDMSR